MQYLSFESRENFSPEVVFIANEVIFFYMYTQ